MKPKRILIWGGWYGSRNVGDEALLLSITDLIGDSLGEVEFIVITDNPAHVLGYTGRDSKYAFRPLHTRRQFPRIVSAFRSADLFIFGGGVPFYDDAFHSVVIILFTVLSSLFRVPCVLWTVSSQRIRSAFTRLALRCLLARASVVTYRDSHTRQLFVECGLKDERGGFAADPAFTLCSADAQNAARILEKTGRHADDTRPLVALTPRLLRGRDGEAHIHYALKSAEQSRKEIEVFAAVLDWLWENGYQPIFVPMNTVAPDDDRAASSLVQAKARYGRNALLIDEEIFPRDAANVFACCQAAFVARVHGSILAFLGGCPPVMYAFDLKHAGIMNQMGLAAQIFDPETGSPAQAVALLETVLRLRGARQAEMAANAGEFQRQARVPLEAVLYLL